jgi:hypothetical protein
MMGLQPSPSSGLSAPSDLRKPLFIRTAASTASTRVRKYVPLLQGGTNSISTQEPKFCDWICPAKTMVTTAEPNFPRTASPVDIIALANELHIATTDAAARDNFVQTNEGGFSQRFGAKNLNIETIASNSLLPTHGQWAIRFNAGGTVTIVLGIPDYWRGWYFPAFREPRDSSSRGSAPASAPLLLRFPSGRFSDPRAKSGFATAKPYRPRCKSSRGDH